ncbi:MAG: serine hydrolase domain-containing protein [Thermomicrobiales bacterium]
MTSTSAIRTNEWPTIDAMESTIRALMTEQDIPGVNVLISAPDRDTWIASFGVANRETGEPMRPEMHTRIGSITKPMTATIILQLVDDGLLSLNVTLDTMLPEASDFPHADRITLRQMLSMRSGIFNYTEEDGVFEGLPQDPDRIWTDQELLDIARKREPDFEPGTSFHYSNTNYIMAGMILERLTGLTFADALQQRLLTPLELAETSLPSTSALPEPFPRGYERIPLHSENASDENSTDSETESAVPTTVIDATEIAPSIGAAAGAVVSTLAGLNRWVTATTGGWSISESSLRERMTLIGVLKPDGEASGLNYGLGIADFGGLIGHNGGIPGFQSFAAYHPASGANIVVLANIDSGINGKAPADSIAIALGKLLAPSELTAPT